MNKQPDERRADLAAIEAWVDAAWEATIGMASKDRHAVRMALSGFRDVVAELAEAQATIKQLAKALEPFADPYNWHRNYDGSGIIFGLGGLAERENELVIDRAKREWAKVHRAALSGDDK